MFVVMTVGASEAEILGVKSQILAEGLTPFDHVGAERTVIAVVGEIGSRRPALLERLRARCRASSTVTPISRPFKLTSREFHPEDTVIRVLDAVIGDGSLTVMAGPCSVESREQLFETADAVKAAGATILRGGAFKPRTSPVRVPGPRRRGPALPRRGARADRPAGHHRGDGAEPGRHRRRVRRHPPDRHPEHAELLAAARRRPGRPAGDAQARLRRDDRGVADGRRVHRQLGQPERDPVRARHPDVRDVHPQHAGPVGRAAPPPPDPPAGRSSTRATPPASAGWSSRSPSAASRSAPTGSWSRSTRTPTRPCRTPSSSSTSTSSAT